MVGDMLGFKGFDGVYFFVKIDEMDWFVGDGVY